MQLIAFGTDERMRGLIAAAERAGWACRQVTCDEETQEDLSCDAAVLPWPRSFRDDILVGAKDSLSRERVLSLIGPCRAVMIGNDVRAQELPQAQRIIVPQRDEAFLRKNARLTAEGAMLCILQRRRRALLGSTVVVTGYGRIGQEIAVRLTAMGAFVIVCARNEGQMRMAHAAGAHPVPLAQIASACSHADVVVNTVPAQVLGEQALGCIRKQTFIVELASAPYGLDMQLAVQMGLDVAVESGLPGRYAPMDAGEALFEALIRAMTMPQGEKEEAASNE